MKNQQKKHHFFGFAIEKRGGKHVFFHLFSLAKPKKSRTKINLAYK